MTNYPVLTHLDAEIAIDKWLEAKIAEMNFADYGLQRQAEKSLIETAYHDQFKLRAFYSQVFTPSLIPQLFEGWKEEFHGGLYRQLTEGADLFIDFAYRDVYSVGLDAEFPNPETLADFLSDAKRAGIALAWREEIVDKHSFLKP